MLKTIVSTAATLLTVNLRRRSRISDARSSSRSSTAASGDASARGSSAP
jgi:hypothetical protein